MHKTSNFSTFKYLAGFYYLALTLAGLGACVAVILFFFVLQDLPRVPEPLSRIIETPATEIIAGSGERILVLGGKESIPLDRVSPYFVRAVLATEDHRFWEHHGVDKLRTLKALWITLFESGKVQGASTITQQLAKNLFFSFKRSYKRKFHELLVALQIESRYSKNDILQAYMNQIPFGVGAHGIENASQTFFGKSASDLDLAEAALLAGLPKSPSRYNPYLHLDRAKARQQIVLGRMVAVGAISRAEADTAYRKSLSLQPFSSGARTGSYFIDTVIQQLEDRYGPEVVYHGGLKITTTLDPQMQRWAVESVKDGMEALDSLMGLNSGRTNNNDDGRERPQAALVAVETNTGAVKALVGGRNYAASEYNRAIQNNRLPGSGFKPFLYYTVFDKLDLHPASVFEDKPVRIPIPGAGVWQPQNFSMKFEGPMILKQAFIHSVNTIAAQLVELTEPEAVTAAAKTFGIDSPLEPVYSIALGTSGVSPLEMASSFATFATNGIRHEPFFIRRVEDAEGRILEEHIVRGEKHLDPACVYQVVDMMQGVVDEGTASMVRQKGFKLPAAGKTGTTNQYKDAWFTGFTPTLCASVWVGYDRQIGLRDANRVGITGSRGASPIWVDFMMKATAGEPSRDFSKPPNIHIESVDSTTGRSASFFTKTPVQVVLKDGQELKKPWQ
ncbi:MAG: PBP1A family penicillin-binding protein [Deltaproteobacteria bacterium]|nr:PBP1A family penicillin-binding protein [Deltaproteobacteria bacterium]